MAERQIDRASLPLAEFILNASDLEGGTQGEATDDPMRIERAKLGMPVELEIVVDERGEVTLGATPPLYYLDTSVMPVFHQVTLTLEPMVPSDDG